MRFILFAIVAALLGGCALTGNSIDHVTASLEATHGLWVNGFNSVLDLNEKASTEKVIERLFEKASADRKTVVHYKILSIREVHIQGGSKGDYTAALVETNFGRKVVLIKYQGPVLGWWHRIYDPKTMEWWG